MDEGTGNSIVSQYGFLEMPSVVEGQRTFIVRDLAERYANREKGKYVLLLHRVKKEHFILGMYDDLKEVLQARHITNLVLNGGHKFNENMFIMAHYADSGLPIEDKFYDVKTGQVKQFEEEKNDDTNEN